MPNSLTTPWLRHFWAFLVITIAVLASVHRLVAEPTGVLVGPQNGGRNDLTANMLPWRSFLSIGWEQAGHPPMWNPYGLSGIPWLGNPQSAMFYPPNWLFLITTAAWLPGWIMVGHLIFAGIGVYMLGNWWRWSWGICVLVGCAFSSAPFLIAHLGEGHYNQICVAAWLPWGLWGFLRLRENRQFSVPLLAGIFSMAFFAGHVQELFYLILTLSLWVLWELLSPAARRRQPSSVTLARDWVLTGIALIGLIAIELGPTYAYTHQAVRASGVDIERAATMSIRLESLWQLWNPFVFGGPTNYHGPGYFYWESVLHFGVLLTISAVLAPVVRFHDRMVWRLFLTLLLCLVFAAGTQTPMFPLFYKYVPGVSMFRGPVRLLFWVSLLVCLLGGFTTQAIADFLTRSRQSGQALAIGFTVVLLGVVTAENVSHAHVVLRVIPELRTESAITSYLKERIGNGTGDYRRVIVDQNLLSDREAWPHGISKVHAYDPVPLLRAVILMDVLDPHHPPDEELIGLKPAYPARYRQNILDFLAVRYAVVPANGPTLDPSHQSEWAICKTEAKFVTAEAILDEHNPKTHLSGENLLAFEIWENLDTLPRAFVVGQATEVQDTRLMIDHLARLNPRQEVLVAKDVWNGSDSRQRFQPADIVEFGPDSMTIQANLDAPGYLVVSDLYSPGWRATVNGQLADVIPVNLVHRGVALKPGEHTVRLWYAPPGFRFWAIISVATLGFITAISLRPWLSTKRRVTRRDPAA